jgi:hypothetical protein
MNSIFDAHIERLKKLVLIAKYNQNGGRLK